jgi:hypothetical protein
MQYPPRTIVAMLISAIIAGAVILPVLGSGIEIPIVAYILNAGPEAISISVIDDVGHETSSVDPGVDFTIEVVSRDNNTAADILMIQIILFAPGSSESSVDSPAEHYTMTWTSSGGFQGSGLEAQDCQEPPDMDGAEGTWVFGVRLAREAVASAGWSCLATVEDEAESDRITTTFGINEFASASLDSASINFAGDPGSEAMTSVTMRYDTNHPVEVGARSSEFVGTEVTSFTLQPGDFTVDDDSSSSSPETGRPKLVLSESRGIFIDDIQGSGQVEVYIFVSIPDPFYDQDYQGKLVFDVRSR